MQRLGVEPGRFILTAARLVPEKAIHELIEAHEKSGSPDKLLIAGAAQAQCAYAENLLRRASDRVIFAGQLPRQELACLYSQARVFVLASHHEGLPIAALEALSAGARVLLSDIQANQDLQLPSRNYFPCGNPSALAKALQSVDDIPKVDAAEIRRRYDWDRIAEGTADILSAWVPASDAAVLVGK
jgi:glycosyltransferase involved in cell wall biosynthesis